MTGYAKTSLQAIDMLAKYFLGSFPCLNWYTNMSKANFCPRIKTACVCACAREASEDRNSVERVREREKVERERETVARERHTQRLTKLTFY